MCPYLYGSMLCKLISFYWCWVWYLLRRPNLAFFLIWCISSNTIAYTITFSFEWYLSRRTLNILTPMLGRFYGFNRPMAYLVICGKYKFIVTVFLGIARFMQRCVSMFLTFKQLPVLWCIKYTFFFYRILS